MAAPWVIVWLHSTRKTRPQEHERRRAAAAGPEQVRRGLSRPLAELVNDNSNIQ